MHMSTQVQREVRDTEVIDWHFIPRQGLFLSQELSDLARLSGH